MQHGFVTSLSIVLKINSTLKKYMRTRRWCPLHVHSWCVSCNVYSVTWFVFQRKKSLPSLSSRKMSFWRQRLCVRSVVAWCCTTFSWQQTSCSCGRPTPRTSVSAQWTHLALSSSYGCNVNLTLYVGEMYIESTLCLCCSMWWRWRHVEIQPEGEL